MCIVKTKNILCGNPATPGDPIQEASNLESLVQSSRAFWNIMECLNHFNRTQSGMPGRLTIFFDHGNGFLVQRSHDKYDFQLDFADFTRFHKISKSSASPNGVKVLAIGSRFLLR